MISCVIPAYNEEEYLGQTLDALFISTEKCPEPVEIFVVDDGSIDRTDKVASQYPVCHERISHRGRVKAKNHGAKMAQGEILVFVDADCKVSSNFFPEIAQKAKNPFYVGGGVKFIKVPRVSLGLWIFLAVVAFILVFYRITVGAFWVRRKVFDSIGGFSERRLDDIDFARRLKRYAREHGKKFESLKNCSLLWSTRKFDQQGDWMWIRLYR